MDSDPFDVKCGVTFEHRHYGVAYFILVDTDSQFLRAESSFAAILNNFYSDISAQLYTIFR